MNHKSKDYTCLWHVFLFSILCLSNFFLSGALSLGLPLTAMSLQTGKESKTIRTFSKRRMSSLVELRAFWNRNGDRGNVDTALINGDGNVKQSSQQKSSEEKNRQPLPFVIDRIQKTSKQDSQEISDLVINVFFDEEAERKQNKAGDDAFTRRGEGVKTPWKAMQLAYLRNLQRGDLLGKKFVLGENLSNDMFVAREVVTSSGLTSEESLIDPKHIYNFQYLEDSNGGTGRYTRGQILGFVDITERNFGIGAESDNTNELKDEALLANKPIKRKSTSDRPLRPVLTNLSVIEKARRSGVGSQLVEACEHAILNLWPSNYYEIILEVEEENVSAQKFYEKRGYEALFSDPTSRRFDTSGFLLQKVRTTKICYRKDLRYTRAKNSEKNGRSNDFGSYFGSDVFRKIFSALDNTS